MEHRRIGDDNAGLLQELLAAREYPVPPEIEAVLRLADGLPGPNCLQPRELALLARPGSLPPNRMEHAQACDFCDLMITSSVPPEELRDLTGAAAAAAAGADRAASILWAAQGSSRSLASLLTGARTAFVAVTAPVVLGLALLWAAGWVWASSAAAPAAATILKTTVGSASAFALLATATAAILSIALVPVRLRVRPWAGALAGGIALAIAVCAYVARDVRHETRNVEARLTLGRERLGKLALASMQHRQITGEFLLASSRSDLVSVSWRALPDDRALACASTPGLPGALYAELGPEDGRLWWQHGKTDDAQGRILTGRVETATTDRLALRTTDGHIHDVKLTASTPPPHPGAHVIVALSADLTTASLIQASPQDF